jgi:prevent-host-death family protein
MKMEKTVPAFKARRQFGTLIDDVCAKGDKVIVERHGKPVAVMVPLSVYEQWKASRDRFFELVERAARNANLSEEEGERLAEEAVAWARSQR